MKTSRLKKTGAIQHRLILAAFGFSLALTASGQDFDTDWGGFPKPRAETTRFGISPFYGYRWGGEIQDATTGANYSFKDGPAYGLILDYAPLDYRGRFELVWSRQDSSVDFQGNNGLGNVDITIDVIQLGGETEYGSERLRGYVSAHAGATHYSSDGNGENTKFSFDIGAGVKAFLTKNIYLRADLRGISTVTDAEGAFIYVNGVAVATFSGNTLWQGQVSAGVGITF
jgi:opacity protein-like surface antigen